MKNLLSFIRSIDLSIRSVFARSPRIEQSPVSVSKIRKDTTTTIRSSGSSAVEIFIVEYFLMIIAMISIAARSIFKKEKCRGKRREQNGEAKLQHDLISKRVLHREELFKNIQQDRIKHYHISHKPSHPKFFSEKSKADNEQQKINQKVDLRCREGQCCGKYNRHTGDTAERKIIRKFENINSDIHDQHCNRDQKIFFARLAGLKVFFVCIDSPLLSVEGRSHICRIKSLLLL